MYVYIYNEIDYTVLTLLQYVHTYIHNETDYTVLTLLQYVYG